MALIYQVDSLSATEGRYSFMTESNSFYEVRISKGKRTLIRFPQADNSRNKFRKDNEEIKIIGEFSIIVGETVVFILEPLGIFGDFTIRETTIVKSISYIH